MLLTGFVMWSDAVATAIKRNIIEEIDSVKEGLGVNEIKLY
jgi:hypothetical protein